MRRSFDLDVLDCPKCHSRMEPIAVLTHRDVIDPILSHLRLPLGPASIGAGGALVYDITGEPIPGWAVGVDPEPEPDERGPPRDWDCIDAPAPDD